MIFVPMENNQKYEEYLRDVLEIPFVNLKGLEIKYCEVILKTVQEFFSKYPILKRSICAIEPVEGFKKLFPIILAYQHSGILFHRKKLSKSSFYGDRIKRYYISASLRRTRKKSVIISSKRV